MGSHCLFEKFRNEEIIHRINLYSRTLKQIFFYVQILTAPNFVRRKKGSVDYKYFYNIFSTINPIYNRILVYIELPNHSKVLDQTVMELELLRLVIKVISKYDQSSWVHAV